MKQSIKDHIEEILITCTLLLLVAVGASYIWGIGVLVGDIDNVIRVPTQAASTDSFNIQKASQIDFRGLDLPSDVTAGDGAVNAPAVQPATPPAASTSTAPAMPPPPGPTGL